jgi:gliding motility-associated-like protein
LWDFGNGITSTENSPLYSYPAAGEFIVTLIAKSSNGCRDTFSLSDKIIALEESMLQIPNAFTPNQSNSPGTIYDPNDKSNDIFHPVLKGVEKFKMSIYSRWGELLFETLNPDEGWDGYYRGKLCVQDIYVWKISATFLDGKKFDKTGDLLLMN